MKNPSLSQCPVCDHELAVTRYYCNSCDTTIEGHFTQPANPFSALTSEQLEFLMTFIRCEGKFNRMEDELKLSYPTLRNRFGEILKALGYETKEESAAGITAEDRMRILSDLSDGKITASEARAKLANK